MLTIKTLIILFNNVVVHKRKIKKLYMQTYVNIKEFNKSLIPMVNLT
jgi:hypothetical protein